MDDLLEILELPLEVYAEYWAGARCAAGKALAAERGVDVKRP